LVAGELSLRESSISEYTVEDPTELPPQCIPLMVARDGRIRTVGTAESFKVKKGDNVLLLQRTGSYLARALAGGGMVDMEAKDFLNPFPKLVAAAKTLHPKLDTKQILADLETRAASFPTEIEKGVYTPNADADNLPTRICILGRDPEFNQLAFLVLSPPSNNEGHLTTLAEIARLCHRPEHREALLQAADHSRIVAYTRDHAHTL
jgi:mannitol/fructose-specific phosphotransferase system IIA component (Ntr-type)